MQITNIILLKSYTSTKAPHTERRVEGLCECCLDSVQKLHAIQDTVKCKCSCSMIHVDANTWWHWSCNIFALIIVHKGEFGIRAVQTPRLVVPAQAAFIAISFTADSPVGNSHVHLCSPPVHLPVTTSPSHALSAQHLLPVVKSVWVIRVVLRLTLHRSCSVTLREVKVWVDSVDIQNQLAGVFYCIALLKQFPQVEYKQEHLCLFKLYWTVSLLS